MGRNRADGLAAGDFQTNRGSPMARDATTPAPQRCSQRLPMTLLLLAASLPLAIAACREPPADNRTEGTRRMARRLVEIAEGVDPLAHPYANDVRVRHFRE